MRILFLNQFFWPDPAPTGKLMADLAGQLQADGHQVTVLAGESGYEEHATYADPQISVIRLQTAKYSRHSVWRMLSWLSFLGGALLRALLLPRQDLVVCLTSPPGLSYVGLLLQWLRGTQLWIWEMDLYPDVAEGVGLLRSGSLAQRVLRGVMNFPRRQAAGVLVLGECMKERLAAQGVPREKLIIAENWAENVTCAPVRREGGEPLRILYSGNLGLAHDVETISEVIQQLANDNRFEFVFCGGGKRRGTLEALVEKQQIGNVRFLGYQDEEEFGRLLESAHIGLITLLPGCVGTVVPSKMYSLLAAGRPVLFIGPDTAATAIQIERFRCGWHAMTGEARQVEARLRVLEQWRDQVEEAGAAARVAYLQYFNKAERVGYLSRQLTTEGAARGAAA